MRCTPLSPPSLVSSLQPLPRSKLSLSSLNFASGVPFSFSLPLLATARISYRVAHPGCTHSPPPARPTSSDPGTCTKKDAATLAVCVLVAMPDVSAPVHRPVPDPKGKGMDPLEAQTPDPDPFLSSPHRGARISDTALDEEGPPLLEFDVVEMRTGAWRT